MDYHGVLVLLIILMCLHVGTTLHCACREDLKTCISIDRMRVDFKTAQEQCLAKGGKPPTSWNTDFAALLSNNTGHFWIGAKEKSSARCVSVSGVGQQTERSCDERIDGFICDGVQWQNCWINSPSEVLILSKIDCSMAPCEHRCNLVPGVPGRAGYICSCFSNYRPSKNSPNKCTYYCNSSVCKPQCRAQEPSCKKYCSDLGGSQCTDTGKCPSDSECEQKCTCECPDGFVKDEKTCLDIDECVSNHDCRHQCSNTRGSYKCSCKQGYMLVNRSECVLRLRAPNGLDSPTSSPTILLTPSLNYTASQAGLETPAEYVVFIVLIVLAIPALIAISCYFKNRKSNPGLNNCDVLDNTRTQEEL